MSMFEKKEQQNEEHVEEVPVLEDTADEVETLIGPSVKVGGNFTSQGNVVVKGMVTGNLTTEQHLTLEEGAKIAANVQANSAVIAGEIKGNVRVFSRVELLPTAQINGDVEAQTMVVDEGAVIEGKCIIGKSPTSASKAKKIIPKKRLKIVKEEVIEEEIVEEEK